MRAVTLISVMRIRILYARYLSSLQISNQPRFTARWNSSMLPCRSARFLKTSEAARPRLGFLKVVLDHGERGVTLGQAQTCLKHTTVDETNPLDTTVVTVMAISNIVTNRHGPGRLRAQARYAYPSCLTRDFSPSMEMLTPKYSCGVPLLIFRFPFFQHQLCIYTCSTVSYIAIHLGSTTLLSLNRIHSSRYL